MEQEASLINTSSSPSFDNNTIIIIVLVILLLLSFLGINMLTYSGNFLQSVTNIFEPIFVQFFSFLGNITGKTLNTGADTVGVTAKTGINIAEGTVHSIGDLLQNKSNPGIDNEQPLSLSSLLPPGPQGPPGPPGPQGTIGHSVSVPAPDSSENPIQNPITSSKTQWCLVGEYQTKRGCIEVTEQDKCMSGQIFPTQQSCLNPTIGNGTANYYTLGRMGPAGPSDYINTGYYTNSSHYNGDNTTNASATKSAGETKSAGATGQAGTTGTNK